MPFPHAARASAERSRAWPPWQPLGMDFSWFHMGIEERITKVGWPFTINVFSVIIAWDLASIHAPLSAYHLG